MGGGIWCLGRGRTKDDVDEAGILQGLGKKTDKLKRDFKYDL